MSALWNHKHETIAQELAAGRSPEEASATAGYPTDARSFESNSRKRARLKDIQKRVREIRRPAVTRSEDGAIVTSEWMLAKCHSIASPNLGRRKIKVSDQIAALALAAKINGFMAPQRHDHMVRTPADELTDDELARIAASDGGDGIEGAGGQEAAPAPPGS